MAGPLGVPYVTPADLPQYLPAATLNLATADEQMQACLDATEEIDSYFRGRYALPLLDWGNDVRRFTGYIAVYLLMTGPIGLAPQAGSDSNITQNYYRAVGWPDRVGTGWGPGVQRQMIHPDVTPTVAQPGDPVHDVPQVMTSPLRGWNNPRGPQRV
jgi:phage gp36-like protein